MMSEQLQWSRKKLWGYTSSVYSTDVTIGDNKYAFVLDKPSGDNWVARGWVNGTFFHYVDSPKYQTLKALKAEIERVVAGLRSEAACPRCIEPDNTSLGHGCWYTSEYDGCAK